MTHLESKGIPAEVSRELKQEVTEGRRLSDAMARQPRIFSDLYVNMVRAGEQSGSLVEVLRRMATHFQQFAEVQAKFTSAMIYPAHGDLRGHRAHRVLHVRHDAAIHRHFQRLQHRAAAADADADRLQHVSHGLLVAAGIDRRRRGHFVQTLSRPARPAGGNWTNGR